jgi:excisionase family DNA binding protein
LSLFGEVIAPLSGWHEICLFQALLIHIVIQEVPMDEILTAGEVAELLQIHPRTVYKLVKEGSIPGRKFGGGWRFSRNEILAMVSPQGSPPSPGKLHTEEH